MRECQNNFAHGPLKLSTKTVTVHYRNRDITCPKSVYTCDHCGFELHEEWMKEKLERELADIYNSKYGELNKS